MATTPKDFGTLFAHLRTDRGQRYQAVRTASVAAMPTSPAPNIPQIPFLAACVMPISEQLENQHNCANTKFLATTATKVN